ncbi:MAG: transcriptional repressor LexA [Acidobacteriota bacterium]
MALTKRQHQVLEFLDGFIREQGYCPSFSEIGKSLGLTSSATVHKHINTLERKGFIRRGPNQSRSIELVDRSPIEGRGIRKRSLESSDVQLEIPMLGRIAAGKPLEAVASDETLSLKDFVGTGNVYVLRVRGDSMIDDHICDGDFVVVEKTVQAENGDTVVALIDNNEATLKRFYLESNGVVRLQPANSAMEPILIRQQDLKIQGRVIGVLRKY